MLTRVFYKLLCFVLSLFSVLGLSATVLAHEFWLEPLSFKIEQGANLQANIKVGQGLEGETYAFFPTNFERFDLTVNGTTRLLKNRFAQKPAVDQASEGDGLHILTYQSRPSKLRYEKREVFEKFLKDEGLEWVLAAHEKRGLPPLEFTELFKRFSKTLIKVGDGKGEDRQMGLPFEWVVLTNPYTDPAIEKVTAQLFFKGEPFPNSAVNVFIKRHDKVNQVQLKTDEMGKVEVSVDEGGLFLINAVHMVEPQKALASSTGAAWMSLWASTTFMVD